MLGVHYETPVPAQVYLEDSELEHFEENRFVRLSARCNTIKLLKLQGGEHAKNTQREACGSNVSPVAPFQ